MQSQLFNSTFEMELRVILLLSATRKSSFTIDRIVNLDFIVCYAENFQLPYENLHGDNDFMYGELASRRESAAVAIKGLVTKGLISVNVSDGYFYTISDSGKKYSKMLKSEYATEYREIATAAIKMFKGKTDQELDSIIHRNAIKSLKGR